MNLARPLIRQSILTARRPPRFIHRAIRPLCHTLSTSVLRRTFATVSDLPSASSPTHQESYSHSITPLSSRTLPETKGLLLISVPTTPKHWGSVIEKQDPIVGAANLSKHLREGQIRILATYEEDEAYSARLFRVDGSVATFSQFNEDVLESPDFIKAITGESVAFRTVTHPEVVICTHGTRDCRCGDIGSDVVAAIRIEAALQGQNIRVTECSHVGGHKFAANAILLPSLHMLGNLRATDAPTLVSHLKTLREGDQSSSFDKSMWNHFRGAFGKTIGEQVSLYESNTTASTTTMEAVASPSTTLSLSPRKRHQQIRAFSTICTPAGFRPRSSQQRPNFRMYSNTTQSQQAESSGEAPPPPPPPPPPKQSVGNKLKDLMKKYGKHAVGVYAVLSFLDFSLAFVGVHLVGAERLEGVKDVIMDYWYKFSPPLPEPEHPDHEGDGLAKDFADTVQAADTEKKNNNTLLWAEIALAYTIHKTLFLPVRVGLTAAWTPKLVKWLTSRGWIGKGGIGRAAAHAQDKVKDAQGKIKDASARIRNKGE